MKKAKRLLIVAITLCMAILFAPNAVHAEEQKVAASSVNAYNFVGGWEIQASHSEHGIKGIIPGASSVGGGEAWKYKLDIGNSAAAAPIFSIKDGNVVSIELSFNMFDSEGNVVSKSQNSDAIDIAIHNAENGAELALFRIWSGSASALNGSHSYEIYGPGWSHKTNGTTWIKGDATLNSSVLLQIDKENLLSSYVGGSDEITRLDDGNNTFLNGVKDKFADVDAIFLKIGGENGFTNDTEVYVKSINGQSLVSTDGYISDAVAPTFLDAAVETELTKNEAYTIPTEAYDFFGGVTYSLIIGDETIEGKTFTPTEDGEMSVTLVASDLAGNKATKDYTFAVSSVEEPYVAASWRPAAHFAGGWEVASSYVADGIKKLVPGAASVGTGEAWRYKGTVNNNAQLNNAFSIKDGNVVSFEFAIGYYDESGNLITGCQNDGGAAVDIYVCDAVTGAELTIFRIWSDSGSPLNGSHSYTIWGPGWSHETQGATWIKGDATLGSSFYIQFDKENLLSSYVGGSDAITRLDDGSNKYLNNIKSKFADVEYVKFMIGGSNGFKADTEIIVKSINGQSLANTDGVFTDTIAPTILDANVSSTLTVGDVYQIPTEAYDFYSSVNYSLEINGKTYNGRTFSPKEAGELTVTLVAKDAASNESRKEYTFSVVSNISAPELTEVPTLENLNVLYFETVSFAKPTFTDATGTAVTVLKVYKGEELLYTLNESKQGKFDLTVAPALVSGEYSFVYEVTNTGGTTASDPQTITITTEEVVIPEFVSAGANVLFDYVEQGIRVRTTSNWRKSYLGSFDIAYGLDFKFIVTEQVSNGKTNSAGTCVDFILTNVEDPNYQLMYRVWCKFGASDADAPTNVFISYDGGNTNTDITDTGWINCNVDGVKGQYHMLFDMEETFMGERTGGVQRVDRAYEALVAFLEKAPSTNFNIGFQCADLSGHGYYEMIITELNGQSFASTNGVVNEVKDAVLEIGNVPSLVLQGMSGTCPIYAKDIFASVTPTVMMTKPDGTTAELEVVDGNVTLTFDQLGEYKFVVSVVGSNGNTVKKEITIMSKSTVTPVEVQLPEGYKENYGIGEEMTILDATYSTSVVEKIIQITKPDGSVVTLTVGEKFKFETSGIYVLSYIAKDDALPTPNEATQSLTINVADTTKPVVNVTVVETAKVNDSITVEINVVEDSEYDVTVTLTNPDATAQKLASPYTFTVSALGKYTLKVVVEDIYGNVETITKEITVTAVETEQPGTNEPANNGCGGSVIASIFGVLALAGTVVVLRKKREE